MQALPVQDPGDEGCKLILIGQQSVQVVPLLCKDLWVVGVVIMQRKILAWLVSLSDDMLIACMIEPFIMCFWRASMDRSS